MADCNNNVRKNPKEEIMDEFKDGFASGLMIIDHLTDEQIAMIAKMFEKENV